MSNANDDQRGRSGTGGNDNVSGGNGNAKKFVGSAEFGRLILWAVICLILGGLFRDILVPVSVPAADRLALAAGFKQSQAGDLFQVLASIWTLLLIYVAGILLFIFLQKIWRLYRDPKQRALRILSLFVVLVLGILILDYKLSDPWRFRVILATFMVIVCVLPALLYVLFSMTRRVGMINEFLATLERLGHFKAPTRKSGEEELSYVTRRRNRMHWVYTYIEKFQSVYGQLLEREIERINEHSITIFEEKLIGSDFVTNSDGAAPAKGAVPPADSGNLNSASVIGLLSPGSLIPITVCTALITLGWMVILPVTQAVETGDIGAAIYEIFIESLHPVLFAFLGAYFFSLQMLFRRFLRSDLSRFAYVNVSIRLILSVIAAWVFTAGYSVLTGEGGDKAVAKFIEALAAADPSSGGTLPWYSEPKILIASFVIGAFPFVFWRMITRYANLTFASIMPGVMSHMNIRQIDGLTIWHQARLEEEDIENIPNLATTDMVDLIIHTQLPTARIVDWVDQAILYTALGSESDKREKKKPAENPKAESEVPGAAAAAASKPSRLILREQSIRTASQFLLAYDRSKANDENLKKFKRLLSSDDDSRSPVRTLWDTLPTYSNLKQIMYWRGMDWENMAGCRLRTEPMLGDGTRETIVASKAVAPTKTKKNVKQKAAAAAAKTKEKKGAAVGSSKMVTKNANKTRQNKRAALATAETRRSSASSPAAGKTKGKRK